MNKELKARLTEEFAKVYKTDEKMIKFCVDSISGMVELESGSMYCFEKPSIETRFCFGYGQNGISTEEDFENAVACRKRISQKEAFFAANMEKFNDLEKTFNYEGNVYGTYKYDKTEMNLRNLYTEDYKRYWGKIHGIVAEVLTETDKINLLKELENQKKMFEKRLETYWKRFGASKLKTWTYLVD